VRLWRDALAWLHKWYQSICSSAVLSSLHYMRATIPIAGPWPRDGETTLKTAKLTGHAVVTTTAAHVPGHKWTKDGDESLVRNGH